MRLHSKGGMRVINIRRVKDMKGMISIFTFLLAALCFLTTVRAEEKVSVKLSTEELALSVNMMGSIELAGEEAGPFVDVMNLLRASYKESSGSRKGVAEVDFPVPMAKNFLFFMQRFRLKGADAAAFHDLSRKIVEGVKKATKS
jgi:hypothetical protein